MISIVIPLLNEQDSLAELVRRIETSVASANLGPFEILLVDDGSTDGSWKAIQQICSTHAFAKGVRFRRNFGKAAALAAGFSMAKGSIVITMDADLQDDPNELKP
ncbi:MAG: glycosyltransferase, partial [Pirellula sp.]